MKTTTTLIFSAGIIASLLFGVVSDGMIKKRGNSFTRKMIAGISFGIMSLAILISTQSTSQLWITVCLVTSDFLLLMIVLTCFATCIEIGGDRVCTITGLMNFCGQSAAFIMSMSFGKIVDMTHNFEIPQYIMFSLLILGGLSWFKIDAGKKIDLSQFPGVNELTFLKS